MLFSVVTVTYNAADLLQKTIESVLGQTSADFEYLIVDGGSGDGTVELIEKYASRLGYWSSEKDTGIYNAMNKAIRQCKGEWVIFMNAGDTFTDVNVLARIAEHCHDNVDLVYGDRHRVDSAGSRRYEKAGELKDAYFREVVFHQSLFTRTSLLRERNYDESYKLAADYEFMLYALRNEKKFQYVELSISDFLEGGASRENYLLAQIEAIKASLHHAPDKNLIRRNYYLDNLVIQNMGRIINSQVQASKRLNPELRLEARPVGNSVNLFAVNGSPELESLLNRINQPFSAENISELASSPVKNAEHLMRRVVRRMRRGIKRLLRSNRNSELVAAPVPAPQPVQKPVQMEAADDRPKVTVVTVCYNAGAALLDTIQSVAAQSYQNLEYIVVDGASTDQTADILKENGGKITRIISEPDQGIYDAMNKAMDIATGEYTIYMNAGDVFYSSDTVKEVFANKVDGFDLVYGARMYSASGEEPIYQEARPLETAFLRMPYCHQSLFLKTSVLREFRFNLTYRFAADYDQSVRLFVAGKSHLQLSQPVCIFAAGGASESGIRPYIETIKILMDNCKDKEIIRKNTYFSSFTRNASSLLDI
jgi:glycosyltransferase involved in cell wall biosynthesis